VLHAGVDASVCGGLEVGRLSAEGRGLIGARRADNLWLAPGVGVELELPLSRALSLGWRLEALSPLARRSYEIDDANTVHRPPAVTARSALEVSFSL
jgi:hypothetical protein